VAANLLTNRFTQVRVALALFFVNLTKGKGQAMGSINPALTTAPVLGRHGVVEDNACKISLSHH
jgi:hypothetical protein